MKARIPILLLLCVTLVILSSCALLPVANSKVCSVCVDINKDGICDRCSSQIKKEEPPHTECKDFDGDLLCDECGEKMPIEEEEEHKVCVDGDKNGVCDECDKKLPTDKPEHTECVDADGNYLCDICEKQVLDKDLLHLIENGKAKFSIVTASDLSYYSKSKIKRLVDDLSTLGYIIDSYTENEEADSEKTEVLIGGVSSRGEKYNLNGRIYGFSGYAIRMIDGKVVICAGSDGALYKAIDYFADKILHMEEDIPSDVYFGKRAEIELFHEYKISSVSIGGRDISGYTVVSDTRDKETSALALSLKEMLYRYTGYDLAISDIASVEDKYISIESRAITGGDGFEIVLDGENLKIFSEYSCKTLSAGEAYFSVLLSEGEGELSLTSASVNTRDVYYRDFGAVGDGDTDDSKAIRAAHEYANKHGHTVVADDDATYYIGPISKIINVTTDVRWGKATFIFDDRDITPGSAQSSVNIFHFAADNVPTATFTPENSEIIRNINANGGIDAAAIKKLDLGLGYAAMLEVYNANHKVYIRTHLVNEGNDQRELIIVDAEGNIDPSTPFLLDYEEVTKITARSIETRPLTIEGGRFITRVPYLEKNYQPYMSRGIVISRANVTVRNIVHEVWDEGDYGCPYAGFLNIRRSVNVRVESSSFMSHKTYDVINAQGVHTNMGTYDIAIEGSNNVLFKNCTQPNFFEVDGHLPYFAADRWGIMGSNYSKNIHYDSCRLSRLDAHCGVYNASLKNCEVVYISVVGGGTLTVEDTTVYNDNLIQLRGDYGSSWKGSVVIKNVKLVNVNDAYLFDAGWTNHNYGYQTYLPQDILIENLEVYRGESMYFISSVFSEKGNVGLDTYNGEENKNPMIPTKSITFKNNPHGIRIILPSGEFYDGIKLITK